MMRRGKLFDWEVTKDDSAAGNKLVWDSVPIKSISQRRV